MGVAEKVTFWKGMFMNVREKRGARERKHELSGLFSKGH